MDVNVDQLRVLLALQGLGHVPEADLPNIALRLSTWLTAMEQIEAAMGPLINEAEPIPPVFAREEF
jgi:hypothetical protein